MLHSSWLLPTALVLVATGLAEAAVRPATRSTPPPRRGTPARGLLAASAGSTLSAATMEFSITISVVVTAATAYGPRAVRHFMDDRSNRAVLGPGRDFLYSLLVPRTIRAQEFP